MIAQQSKDDNKKVGKAGLLYFGRSLVTTIELRMNTQSQTNPAALPRIHLGNGRSARDLPLALADQHRALPIGRTVRAVLNPRPTRDWDSRLALDLAIGAGFASIGPVLYRKEVAYLTLERLHSLSDTVGSGMKLLVVGLNPSPYSADTGIGYARPGNRFWPAVLQAGIASIDRDPRHALRHHGLGMTDLVRRTTRRADEVSIKEYQVGFARVARLAPTPSPRPWYARPCPLGPRTLAWPRPRSA